MQTRVNSNLKNKQQLLNFKGPKFFSYALACPQTEAIIKRQQNMQVHFSSVKLLKF